MTPRDAHGGAKNSALIFCRIRSSASELRMRALVGGVYEAGLGKYYELKIVHESWGGEECVLGSGEELLSGWGVALGGMIPPE
jgi:hypothetical protein